MYRNRLFILIGLITSCSFLFSQNNVVENLPEIEFQKMIYDFGEIEYNGNGDCEFVFKNIGKGPLVIKNVKSS